jgi:hypothetical protein
MVDEVVDSRDIIVVFNPWDRAFPQLLLLVLRSKAQHNSLHPEGCLQYFLCCREEDTFVLIREVQRLRQDTIEFRLLEALTQPLVNQERVQE